MVLMHWEREVGKVRGRGKGREVGVVLFVDALGIGLGNVLAAQSEVWRGKVLVKTGRSQTSLVKVKVQVLIPKVKVKVGGTKVHVSTATKLDIKQQNV